MILSPIEHYEFTVVLHCSWIKRTRGFKTIALRCDNRRFGQSAPVSKGQFDSCCCRGEYQEKQQKAGDERECTSNGIRHEYVPPADICMLRRGHIYESMKTSGRKLKFCDQT